MISLVKNWTWLLVKKPIKAKLVNRKWVFKLKEGIEEIKLVRYKERVIAQGFL